MRKNSKKLRIFTKKIGLKTHLWWVFGHVWTKFFMLVNFSPTLSTYYTFLGQKYTIDFSPDFSHFFTTRPTSESCWEPLKVIPEGSMVEYLPFGSNEAPKPLLAKNIFEPQIPKSHSQPSVQRYYYSSITIILLSCTPYKHIWHVRESFKSYVTVHIICASAFLFFTYPQNELFFTFTREMSIPDPRGGGSNRSTVFPMAFDAARRP